MSFTIQKLQSTAARLFALDPSRIIKLMTLAAAAQVGKKLDAAGTDFIGQGERPTIAFRNFRLQLSSSRMLTVLVAAATEVELTATVDGDTEDAIDAVKAVWDVIGEATSETGAFDDLPGAWVYKTASVVHAPGLVERSFPGVRWAQDIVREAGLQVDARASFRITIPSATEVHGFPTVGELVVEPRLTAKQEDDVFYISSPCKADVHKRLLQKLASTP